MARISVNPSLKSSASRRATYSTAPVRVFFVIFETDVHLPPSAEKSTRSIPLMWNATTPMSKVVVKVWNGTTSQRAIDLASLPDPVPTVAGCFVGAVTV